MHGADNLNQLTKADIIKMCIADLGGSENDSLYIGDTNGDYIGASECDMDFVGVTYGFGFKEGVEYPFMTVNSCVDLIKIMLE